MNTSHPRAPPRNHTTKDGLHPLPETTVIIPHDLNFGNPWKPNCGLMITDAFGDCALGGTRVRSILLPLGSDALTMASLQ